MDGEQLIVWGGAWHPTDPKSHPRFCVANVYTMMHRKEVKQYDYRSTVF